MDGSPNRGACFRGTDPYHPGQRKAMISIAGLLSSLAADYARQRDLRLASRQQHVYTLHNFERFLGRSATLADLCDDTVNRWIDWLRTQPLEPESIKSRRRNLLTLWRAAAEAGAVPPPGRISKVKVPPKMPRAWSQSELSLLLATAAGKHKRMSQHRAAHWCAFWRALILVGYYSGLRLDDLVNLRFDQIDAAGSLVVAQRKTGDPISCLLPADALAALAAIRLPKRRRIFGDLCCRQWLQLAFCRLLRDAGLPGSIKWFRSTGATWCEVAQPGSAKSFLGHRTYGLAYKHYVDPRYLDQQKPLPPPPGT